MEEEIDELDDAFIDELMLDAQDDSDESDHELALVEQSARSACPKRDVSR